MLTVTDQAEAFLSKLIKDQEADGHAIEVSISSAGTPSARVEMAFVEIAEGAPGYVFAPTEKPEVRIATRVENENFLHEAKVDYRENDTGGTIVVDAPNLYFREVSDDSPLDERINYILASEINPSLASHGGMVSLVEVVEGDTAVLQFGGGCQGCGMVDVTLKQGVESTLLGRLPELKSVRDVTDHTVTENAYYR